MVSVPKIRYVISLIRFISFSEHREDYLAPIPEAERGDIILAYHAQLNAVDDETRITAAKAWAKWECVASFVMFVLWAHSSQQNDDIQASCGHSAGSQSGR